jgi:dihydroflavonol-4-reductase
MTRVRVYVTGGGRGFIAAHVVRALREAGHEVSDTWADVRDPDALASAIDGYDAVCHVAALYSFTRPAPELESVNVTGTANVLAACERVGVSRIVHTSSCATCGPVRGRPATEADLPPAWELAVPYKRTKLAAERLALEAGAVCVNPTTPVGEGDSTPTPTGAMVRSVVSGRYRVALRSTGLNLVDVRDVARGHVLALERGLPGERYLLGGVNLTLTDVFAAIARLAAKPGPLGALPYGAAQALAALGLANAEEVALARLPAWFSSARAERELGYTPGPVEPALARAVSELRACAPYGGRRRGG